MKGDRVTIRILCDEEATEGAIGKGGEDGAASLDERVVQHAGVVAGDPEHHAHAEWPGLGKRPDGLSQRQRDRRCLERKAPDMSTMKAQPRNGVDWVGYNLKITQHRLRQRLDAELAQFGITAPQNAVLLEIAGNPRVSNADLARAAFVTPQTMQGILV
jgi:hypothetical protein